MGHWNWIGFIEVVALGVAIIGSGRMSAEHFGERGYRRAYREAATHLQSVVVEVTSEITRPRPYDWDWERSA